MEQLAFVLLLTSVIGFSIAIVTFIVGQILKFVANLDCVSAWLDTMESDKDINY